MEPRFAEVDRLDCRLVPHRWDFAEAEAARIDAIGPSAAPDSGAL